MNSKKCKPDYAFKSYVMREHKDLLHKVKKAKLYDYLKYEYLENGVISPILINHKGDLKGVCDVFNESVSKGQQKEFNECLKIHNANNKRVKRLKKRIETMLLNGACVFLTLTFNNETLETTTEKERRTLTTRYLKTFNAQYVANIDYGSKNHREHYHAIINCEQVDFKAWRKHGNINAQRVRNKDIKSDNTKLAKYICKLSNHAIKETTKRSTLIYSR